MWNIETTSQYGDDDLLPLVANNIPHEDTHTHIWI